MPHISIKKRIEFTFLGEGYEACYAVFRPIPILKYKDFINRTGKTESENIDELVNLLKEFFVEGKFKDDNDKLFDLSKDNIDEFDMDSILNMFNLIAGREPDPKAETN